MADEDLVSEVKIEGLDEATTGLKKLGDAGEEAFDKIDGAATKASKALADAADEVQAGATAFQKLRPASGAVGSIYQFKTSFRRLTGGINATTQSFNNFVTRSRRIGTIVTAVAGGIAASALLTAKAYDDAGKRQSDYTAEQIRSIQAGQQAANAERAHGQSIQDLNQQLVSGKVSFEQYASSLEDLNKSYQRARQEAAITASQERTLREETERLQAAAARTKAFDDLANKLGPSLVGPMITAGRAVQTFVGDVQRALGPALGNVLNRVVALFESNRSRIIAVFDSIAQKIQSFVDKGGVETTFKVIGDALGIISFVITNVIIPAFNSLLAVLDPVAKAINSLFGTNLTAGGLALALILGILTKLFAVLFAVVKTAAGALGLIAFALTNLPAIIGAVGLAIRVVLTTLASLAGAMGPAGLVIAAIAAFVAAFVAAGGDIRAVFNGLLSFLMSLPGRMGGGFTSLWETIKGGATAAVDFVKGAFQTLVTFFSMLPTFISMALTFLWEIFRTGATTAVEYIKSAFNGLVAYFLSLSAQIGEALVGLWELVKVGAQGSVDYVVGLWNQFVTFLQGLPATVGQIFAFLGDTIRSVFDGAINYVKSKFSELLSAAKSYIQPVIDMLRTLTSLLGQADGGAISRAGGGIAGFDGGGRVRGPGTATSDSILARLSNGEYVIKAKSVSKYGTALMDAINSGRFDMGNLIRGFASGGLVSPRLLRPSYAFAEGGPVGTSQRPINLSIGGESFNGLSAPEDVADRLVRFAIKKQTRSAGRKPSWVGL